jgi:superfamily II DNA or RNA helicase
MDIAGNSFLTAPIMGGHDWKSLELAVVRLLQHTGWKDVVNVGQTGDMGADILATKSNNNGSIDSYLFQVKAVTGSNYVGKAALEQAIQAQSVYGSRITIVVTNGDFYKSVYDRAAQLRQSGFDVRLWNGAFLKDLIYKVTEYSVSKRDPRPYQKGIIDSVVNEYEENKSKCFYILATGLGKTFIASSIVDSLYKQGLRKVLVVCHSIDLVLQLEQAFWNQLPKSVVTRRFMGGSPPVAEDGISFGLYQTLIQFLGSLSPDAYDLIIVDEAHHAIANAFSTCINYLTPRFLVGMTATPWRGDGTSVESIFGAPVAKVSLVDGMKMGYLAKVDYRLMCDNINWDKLSNLAGRRFSIRDLNKRLFLPQRDDAVISRIIEIIKSRAEPRILIFSPSKNHAMEFAKKLTAAGIPCACASTDVKVKRNRILLDYATGKLKALTAVDVLNEGIDFPQTNLLVFLRATHSRRIFIQQLGRGLRITNDKDSVTVLDFVTDIRRLAAISDLDNQARKDKITLMPGEVERVVLSDGVVTFSNNETKEFIDSWIEDIASLEEADDSSTFQFPDV